MSPAELARQVKLLQISTRHLVTEVFAGEYTSAFKGRGVEFADVREYEPGDDIRSIDWNVTARAGKPFVKRFTEERELTVVLAVDCSASGLFSSRPDGLTKRELAAEVAALIAFAATKKGDRVGLLLFTDQVEKYVPPRKGIKHALRLIREFLAYEPTHSGTNLRTAADRLMLVLRRRSLVFLVSDFLGVNIESDLSHLSTRHETIALDISDPREFDLPTVGMMDFVDPETGLEATLDTSSPAVRRAYTQAISDLHEHKNRSFARLGIDHARLSTGQPYVHELAGFFIRRERRR